MAPIVAPAAALARGAGIAERMTVFAQCAGRLSARIEFHWLMGSGDGEAETALRREFDALLAAGLPDARAAGLDGRDILHRRISAKAATARLLHLSRFGSDPRRMRLAAMGAQRQLSSCRALLLG